MYTCPRYMTYTYIRAFQCSEFPRIWNRIQKMLQKSLPLSTLQTELTCLTWVSKITEENLIGCKGLWRWYIGTNIMLLDIIHCLCLYLKRRSVYFSKHNVSETGFCLRLQVRPNSQGNGPIRHVEAALIFFFTARVHTTKSTVNILAANTHCKYFLKFAEHCQYCNLPDPWRNVHP
jgi:hypothetical protein